MCHGLALVLSDKLRFTRKRYYLCQQLIAILIIARIID